MQEAQILPGSGEKLLGWPRSMHLLHTGVQRLLPPTYCPRLHGRHNLEAGGEPPREARKRGAIQHAELLNASAGVSGPNTWRERLEGEAA